MALVLNLNKLEATKKSLSLCLAKAGITTPPVMELCFALDVSGSFVDAHIARRGEPALTELLIERLTAWGMLFDPDKKLDTIAFSNRSEHVGAITETNYTDFVAKNVIDCDVWNGGTNYTPPIRQALQLFGYLPDDSAPAAPEKKGFFGGLFGSKKEVATPAAPVKRKSLVLFVTDGENSDRSETTRLLEQSEKNGDQMYIIFLGVNRDASQFNYIKQLADRFSNVSFDHVADYKKFVELPDDQLNERLINDELLAWMKA
jgi:hypothetical protein